MAPQPTGTLDSEVQADGTLAFRLRFRAYGERQTVFLHERRDYRWRAGHLKRFFGRYGLDEIDGDLCLEFKAHKLREARELCEALQAGADLRDARNRRVVPLGAASLKKLLSMLAAGLGDAIEDKYLNANPARSRWLRIHVPKPKRTFLEIDELVYLEDSAASAGPTACALQAESDSGTRGLDAGHGGTGRP